MAMVWAVFALLAPIGLPMCLTGLYAFGLRQVLPQVVRPTTDKLYWLCYGLVLLIGVGLFVWQIFSWQIASVYQWLWLAVLGVPMLILLAGVLYLSLMATDSW